jgi:hypothetical protein
MKKARKIRRQQVKEGITQISPWDLFGSPEDICKELRETQDAYLKDYNDVIDAHWTWESCPYGDGDGSFALNITRLENDREYNARVKKLMKIKEGEKLEKAKQEQTEYETYLKLQKKFNKQNWKPTVREDYSG